MCKKRRKTGAGQSSIGGGGGGGGGGVFSGTQNFLGVVCVLISKQLNTALVQFKASKTSLPRLQAAATNLLGTYYGMGRWLPLCCV
jgi:hypothetical protein